MSLIATLRTPGLEVRSGELVALAGPPNSGKTTALAALGGVLPADDRWVRPGCRIGWLLRTIGPAEPCPTPVSSISLSEGDLLLADEPSLAPAWTFIGLSRRSSWKPDLTNAAVALLRAHTSRGVAVVTASHDPVLLSACDRVVEL